MPDKVNNTCPPCGARRRPLATDWRAALPTEDRKAADEIVSRYGAAVFERLATAYSAARRKRGAPSKADERAPLLEKMANLLIANPAWKPWRAATVVAREHPISMVSFGGLHHWLRRAFEKDGEQLLARARAVKARHAGAVDAPPSGSPAVLPEWPPALREGRMTDPETAVKRVRDELYARSAVRHVRDEIDAEARARRALQEMIYIQRVPLVNDFGVR